LNNIPEEDSNPSPESQDNLIEEDLDLEPSPQRINRGVLGTRFSFDDMNQSGISDARLSVHDQLEVEDQAPQSPNTPLSQAPIENRVVRTVLEDAMKNQAAKARARSSHKYNKQHTIERFLAGDIVSLKIPREDRAATDPPRIFCRVMTESYPNRYKLQTAYGLLKNHYPVNALLRVPEAAGINISIPTTLISTEITLHAAAGMVSTSDRIGISCNCKGPRCSGRCRCIRNKVQCSVHCHSHEFDCGNLSPLTTRTELALIERHTPDIQIVS